MIQLKEEYEIYNFLKLNPSAKEDLNIVIDCKNAVFGRLLSVCSKILTNFKNYKVYLINIDEIVIKKDKVHYSAKVKRALDAGDKNKGPFIPTISTKYIRYRFRSMVDKKKRNEVVKRFITWELPQVTDSTFKIKPKWVFKGFLYKQLISQIRQHQ